MKKLFLLGTVVFFAGVSYAQTIIPKAGVTLSKISLEDSDTDLKSSLGFTLGVGFNFPINKMFSVQPELSFVQKGFKEEAGFSEGALTVKAEDTYKINYLELPVLARATFGSNTKFFLNAGPSFGFGLGGKYKYDFSVSYQGQAESNSGDAKIKFGDNDDEESEDIYVDNRIDLGLQFGGGVIIADKVMIDIRYGLGLSDLIDDQKSKNRVLQFTVGIPLSFN